MTGARGDVEAYEGVVDSLALGDVRLELVPTVFFPRPTIESVVFRWTPDAARRAPATTRRRANELAGVAFRQRRKTIGSSMKGVVSATALAAAGIDASARPETVAPEAWVKLAESA